jgi:arsenate reductase
VHPEVVTAMGELGLDLSRAKPQSLTEELAARASLLVTMGCGDSCPFVPGLKVDDWQIADPKGQPLERVRQIRDDSRRHVRELIAREGWGC